MTVLVTGCDKSFFLSACIVEMSLIRSGFSGEFSYLDFGLSDKQREFLRLRGKLKERPATVGDGVHPYVLKTMISRYLHDCNADDFFVWVDADILLSKQFSSRLNELCSAMLVSGEKIAAAPAWDLEEFLGKFPDLKLDPFKDGLSKLPVADRQYFNSGFIVFRGWSTVARWDELAQVTPFHGVYDQSIFNLIVYEEPRTLQLPRCLWNFHDTDFDVPSSVTWEEGGDVEEEPYVFHLTTSQPGHFEIFECAFEGDPATKNLIRLSNFAKIRALQLRLLADFFERNSTELLKSGLISKPSNVAEALRWHMPRNNACFCGSGLRYKHCHGKAL